MGWSHLLQGLRATLLAVATLAASAGAALAQEGLYDRPVLTLDPGTHTAALRRMDVDAAGRLAVTGSYDGTVRLWRVADGTLARTIRVPQGPGDVGKIYAVATSPDGQIVAAAGWTRWSTSDPQDQIYLFDTATGRMTQRLARLPTVVQHLTFSPDGRYLAATLARTNGLRVYDRDAGWAEQHKSAAYGDDSYGAAWAPAGSAARLATTSYDGKLRLYDANFALLPTIQTPHAQPNGVAFSPDGSRLAVGFQDAPAVALYDTSSFAPLPPPDTAGITNGSLSRVAFDAAGTLYAGGRYTESGNSPAVAWTTDGRRRSLPAGDTTLMSLRPLADGRLLVAAQDPWLGLLRPNGKAVWRNPPRRADLRGQRYTLSLSADGLTIDFGFEYGGKRRARFDLASRTLSASPPDDHRTASPDQTDRPGLTITNWVNSTTPSLNGTRLPLKTYERARSLAIHPDGQRFVVGTAWRLRAFNAAGKQLWEQPVPGEAWAVNISGNGRLVLAAYADGTLRWHAMKDGRELLAFYPIDPGPGQAPKDWVAWTPEGVYTATESAQGILGWHINHGWDEAAEFIPALRSDPTFRPQVISRVLHFRDVRRAQKFVDQQVQQAGRPAATNQQPQPSPPRPKEATRATSTCLTSASAPTAPTPAHSISTTRTRMHSTWARR